MASVDVIIENKNKTLDFMNLIAKDNNQMITVHEIQTDLIFAADIVYGKECQHLNAILMEEKNPVRIQNAKNIKVHKKTLS